MLKLKPQTPYWAEFKSFQTFTSIEDMLDQIKRFESTYILTPAMKAVLNTLKLHSKRFIGVCWLYREQIAEKAGVSLASVKRAIKALKDTGLLSVYPHIHTKRGGTTHNIYVINPIFEPADEPANEPASEEFSEAPSPTPTRVCESHDESYKNSHKNSNTDLKISIEKFDILKNVPNEFIDLMEPFYANSPEIILARWKTLSVAIKRNLGSMRFDAWGLVHDAWKDTVKCYKRGKLKNATDDGLGAYFYGVLNDYLMDYAIRATAFMKQ